NCDIGFSDPQPDDEELSTIYDENYFAAFGFTSDQSSAYREMRQSGCRRILELVKGAGGPGSVLDVGSGLGDFLLVAAQQGWQVTGVDPNQFAVSHANRLLPGKTRLGTLSEVNLPPESFDLVVCLDVIEHVRNPCVTLAEIRRVVKPRGMLLITTIDWRSWLAVVSRSRWTHIHRDHLWYFTKKSLQQIVGRAGFEVLQWKIPRKVFTLRYILSILRHHATAQVWKWLIDASLRCLPSRMLTHLMPPLPEGQLVLARRMP